MSLWDAFLEPGPVSSNSHQWADKLIKSNSSRGIKVFLKWHLWFTSRFCSLLFGDFRINLEPSAKFNPDGIVIFGPGRLKKVVSAHFKFRNCQITNCPNILKNLTDTYQFITVLARLGFKVIKHHWTIRSHFVKSWKWAI